MDKALDTDKVGIIRFRFTIEEYALLLGIAKFYVQNSKLDVNLDNFAGARHFFADVLIDNTILKQYGSL